MWSTPFKLIPTKTTSSYIQRLVCLFSRKVIHIKKKKNNSHSNFPWQWLKTGLASITTTTKQMLKKWVFKKYYSSYDTVGVAYVLSKQEARKLSNFPGAGMACWLERRLMIDRLRVRIPVGAAGKSSSPELTLWAASYLVSVPPPCYSSGT